VTKSVVSLVVIEIFQEYKKVKRVETSTTISSSTTADDGETRTSWWW
jgi:hypothetical protein